MKKFSFAMHSCCMLFVAATTGTLVGFESPGPLLPPLSYLQIFRCLLVPECIVPSFAILRVYNCVNLYQVSLVTSLVLVSPTLYSFLSIFALDILIANNKFFLSSRCACFRETVGTLHGNYEKKYLWL